VSLTIYFFSLAEFWKNLTAESAFLAKVLIKFLKKDQTMEERLDDMLPEVTRHAFTLKYYNDLYRSTNAAQQENTKDYEFITTQMLEIALCLDYADEVGRRKMFEILRDILRSCELTEDHLSKIIQIFRLISLDERDFTRTMIEIISDIQEQLDPFDDLEDAGLPAKRSKLDDDFDKLDTSFSSSTGNFADGGSASFNQSGSQRVLDSLVIRLRCLNICKRMLESCQEVNLFLVYQI
jgi:condensin complex subunit 3